MSLHKHNVYKRSGYVPASGSVVESDPTPTASLLAQNTAAVADPNSTPTGIPLVASSVFENTSTAAAQSSTPTTNTNSSPSAGNQISLGAVIGACVAALIVLLLAVALAFYCSKRQKQFTACYKSRNTSNNASRRRSHLEPWTRMEDDDDRWEEQGRRERPMKQRPPSEPLGAMFHRTISNTSGEKSLEGYNRESVGTMQHFAKYHPGLAAEMASQGAVTGGDGGVAKPPPVLHLMGRGLDMTPPISWDGETVGGDSFVSLHPGSVIATAKSTPPAMTSSLHHWERAEVLHVSQVDSDFSEAGELQSPFADSASSVKSSPKGQNPFFSARDYPVKRKPDTHKNPFADANSVHDSSTALQSLIAALEVPQGLESDDRITSVQSSVYSRMTGDDGNSAISVTAFPYPPTQINR
ncbi:hypothetical protein J3R83DRAFT_11924 [Lanmaoa asiatica]|nr:hypothetical protein J3R83DRAFT_11924 [Lanmaoa asiatica]